MLVERLGGHLRNVGERGTRPTADFNVKERTADKQIGEHRGSGTSCSASKLLTVLLAREDIADACAQRDRLRPWRVPSRDPP